MCSLERENNWYRTVGAIGAKNGNDAMSKAMQGRIDENNAKAAGSSAPAAPALASASTASAPAAASPSYSVARKASPPVVGGASPVFGSTVLTGGYPSGAKKTLLGE